MRRCGAGFIPQHPFGAGETEHDDAVQHSLDAQEPVAHESEQLLPAGPVHDTELSQEPGSQTTFELFELQVTLLRHDPVEQCTSHASAVQVMLLAHEPSAQSTLQEVPPQRIELWHALLPVHSMSQLVAFEQSMVL